MRSRVLLVSLAVLALAGLGWWAITGGDSSATVLEGQEASAAEEPRSLGTLSAVDSDEGSGEGPVATERRSAESSAEPTSDDSAGAPSSVSTRLLSLHGAVRDTTGAFLAGATLELTIDSGVRITRTDETGHYRFEPLPRGFWFARLELDGHMRVHEEIVLPADGDELQHDFEMTPLQRVVFEWEVEGGTGDPSDLAKLAGEPRLHWELLGAYSDPCEWTDESPEVTYRRLAEVVMFDVAMGEFPPGFVVTNDSIGTLTIRDELPIWVALVVNRRVLDCQRVDELTSRIRFVVTREDMTAACCAVRGRVVDAESGQPLEASLTFVSPGGTDLHHMTNALGEFVEPCRADGEETLYVHCSGYAGLARSLRLRSGTTLDLGDLELTRPAELTGWTEWHDPTVSGTVRIALRRIAGGETVEVDAPLGGPFRFDGLERTLYSVSVRHLSTPSEGSVEEPLVSPARTVDLTAGSVGSVALTPVRPSTLVLQHRFLAVPPYPRCAAIDEAGVVVAETQLSNMETPLQLPPGDYTIEVQREGAEPLRRRVEVAGERPTVTLDL